MLSSSGASRQFDATTHTARATLTILCRGDCLAKYTFCPPRICAQVLGHGINEGGLPKSLAMSGARQGRHHQACGYAEATAADNEATNGVVHIINGVMILYVTPTPPPARPRRPPAPRTRRPVHRLRADQRGLRRGWRPRPRRRWPF